MAVLHSLGMRRPDSESPQHPRAPIDLFSFDTEDAPHLDVVAHVEQMVNLHEQIHRNIAATNAKYQVAGSKGKNMLLLNMVIWFGCI
jgi:hypothetical protein